MKIIECNTLRNIIYPVGECLKINLPIIKEMSRQISKQVQKGKEIQFICTGSSGAIIAGMLSLILFERNKINIYYVRKRTDTLNHGNSLFYSDKVNIFVDDIVASGITLANVIDAIYSMNYKIDIICVPGSIAETILNRYSIYDFTIICDKTYV